MYICFDVVHPQICQAQFAFRNQPRRHNTSPFLSHNTNPQNTKQLIYSRFGYGSKLGTPIIGLLILNLGGSSTMKNGPTLKI